MKRPIRDSLSPPAVQWPSVQVGESLENNLKSGLITLAGCLVLCALTRRLSDTISEFKYWVREKRQKFKKKKKNFLTEREFWMV